MNEPKRRTEPRKHLDAGAVPFEQALLHRAAELDRTAPVISEIWTNGRSMHNVIADEFRKLADELRYW